MPKRLSKANQRNRLRLLAYRQGISVGELKHRLKSEDVQESHNPTAPQEAAAQEGVVQEGAAQEAAVPAPPGGTTTVTPPGVTTITSIGALPGGTKSAAPPPHTKRARVSLAQEISVGRGCGREEGEVSAMGAWGGRARELESFLSLREEGDGRRIGVGPNCASDQESFSSPEDGEASAMGIGQGRAREEVEESAMGTWRGRSRELESFLSLHEEGDDSAMGVRPGRAIDQELFILPEEGEQSTMVGGPLSKYLSSGPFFPFFSFFGLTAVLKILSFRALALG